MSEEVSASTGSAPESASTNVGEAAPAGSVGAGEQSGQSQAADPNVSATPESQIDAGWSLEDQPEPEIALPDDDADIEGLLNDPALDQAKVPGLVTELRNARQLAKESKRQAAELKQQMAQLEQFGGMEGVSQTMGLVNDLLTNPQQGIGNFLNSLYNQAYPSYEHLVNSVITANADYAIEQLQQAGKLPDTQQRAGSIDSETLATIPEHLRQIAKSLPADVLYNLLDQPEDVRNYNLERELKLSNLDSSQRQAQEQQWRQQTQQAQAQGQESATKLASQLESAHFSEMSKWKPFGPDDDSSNQVIYKMAFQGALDALLADQKFGQMHTDAFSLLANAPMRRLRNESFAADQDERKGRQLAAQLNTRLGQVLRERVKLLDSVFRDARAYRESQRSEIPQRTEISGMSSQAGRNGAPPTLTKDGKTNPAWLEWVNAGLPGNGARQG
jgi:hypothetical protein